LAPSVSHQTLQDTLKTLHDIPTLHD